jgi:putative membrane protein insertion efficiency factor
VSRRRRRFRDWFDSACDVPDCDGCDGCDGCDLPGCDCNIGVLPFLRLSTVFLLFARLGMRGRASSWAGVAAIRGYQRWLSPRLRGSCPHTPSCSAYGAEAIGRHGLADGSRLVAGRLRRCSRALSPGTPDPVP